MKSFEEFAAAEAAGLLRYATALSSDPDRAADVVQNVLIRAAPRWDRIGSMEFPLAYVRRMVTNGWLNDRQSWWSRRAMLTAPDHLPDRATPGDDLADLHAERSAIEQALALIPRRQRAALVLRHYLGCDDVEIAEELGCAVATVRSLCSRGAIALRARLEPHQTSAVIGEPLPSTAGGPRPTRHRGAS